MDLNLYLAAEEGNLDYLQNLQQTSNLYEQLTPCKETILHVATEYQKTEFIKRALQLCRPLLTLANSSGDTALHIAAGEGNKELVEVFISYMQSSSDIETGEHKDDVITRMVNFKMDTALHCAARIGSYECAKMLAEADPDVCSFVNDDGESPIYLLVASGCWSKDEIIVNDKLALSFTAAAYQGPVGLTALHASVLFRLDGGYKLGEIEKLVKWREEMIREGDNLGMTPLHYAAFYGRTDVVQSFVECCSDAIYLTNKNGETALHLAAYNGCIKVLQQLVILRQDCYNMVDEKGRTALHAAVLGEQKEAVEFILKTPRYKRLINKSDKDGNTPLHLAAHFKFVHIIQIIVSKKKVRFNILNNQRLTPFHLYTTDHTPESIEELCLSSYLVNNERSVMVPYDRANGRLKTMRKEVTRNDKMEITTTTNNDNNQNNLENEIKSELEVNLLVAVLVATMTFAAGFTLPGGLVSNGGEDEGLAIFINKPTFKAFLVFNSIAFSSSIFVVGFHFINSTVHNDFTRLAYKATVKPFTGFSILAMTLGFCFGTFVMLTKSTTLATVPFILSACFMSILLLHIRPSSFLIEVIAMMQHPLHKAKKWIKKYLLKKRIKKSLLKKRIKKYLPKFLKLKP